jgi:pullulanase-type alpha-1,6-glucosidase
MAHSVSNSALQQFITSDQNTITSAAHWLDDETILIANASPTSYYFLAAIDSNNTPAIKLKKTVINDSLRKKFSHLAAMTAFKLSISRPQIKRLLKQKLVVYGIDNQHKINQLYYVQTANVIDVIYSTVIKNQPIELGAKIRPYGVNFNLWAPTAQNVSLSLFNAKKQKINHNPLPMIEDKLTGTWHLTTAMAKFGDYYQYNITVYHPQSQKIETFTTTDPYSLSLSSNSKYSQIIDLNDARTKPIGWDLQTVKPLAAPEDNILYEVHIRDFSAFDTSLKNANNRGKYGAFTEKNSAAIQHLKQLQHSGVNTIHLLPSFDVGTINEEATQAIDLQDPLAKLCKQKAELALCQQVDQQRSLLSILASFSPESDDAQALISSIKTLDNYNWGYDPFHYTVPEGSYAKNPEGISRIVEFRQMIQSLHQLGFRVVMDVVYNHTHAAGLHKTAVLDKIVPNYYHRLDAISGKIAQSTCCDNTATEHAMMAKLMIDSLKVWARDYKIDGFRFDLMGHQPKAVMLAARSAVQQIDPDTYFYGEGWNFGEVANNQRFVQASQLNLAGTEIGTYSDRLRDAVRGPGIGRSGFAIRKAQGIGNGLLVQANELQQTINSAQPAPNNQLLEQYHLLADQLRIGLAGNLANFPLINRHNKLVQGKDIPYGSQPTGYAIDPADTINYVSKHDNQTLWDNNQYRNPYNLTLAQRVRLHVQSLSYTLLAQGIPFFQMGAEFLRSKSFLRDSYDYGDWFNKVDFSQQTNNYNVGLPPREKDAENYPLIKTVLKNNQGQDIATPTQIELANNLVNELIKIRMSSPLFRLRSNKDVLERVHFLNTGSQQKNGLIVMQLQDLADKPLDENYQQILVFFNANPSEQTFALPLAISANISKNNLFKLHPVQQQSADKIVQQSSVKLGELNAKQIEFTLPALTTSVFVLANN